MKLPAIVTGDLHLTSNPRDAYRWGLIPWLLGQAKDTKAKTLAILGDLTDAKDYHPAKLVNDLVTAFQILRGGFFEEIVVLEGNHDYLKGGEVFFQFLNEFPGVSFHTHVQEDTNSPCAALWLPYSKTPGKYQDVEQTPDFSRFDYVFMHQTADGAVASNGQVLEGELRRRFPTQPQEKLYSGDIHVPQIIGDVEYVGSPYHVHFGDKFKPRVVLIEEVGVETDLHFKTIQRVTAKVNSVAELEGYDLKAGDQVKVRLDLSPSERHDWDRLKREVMDFCKRREIYVQGIELLTPKTRRRLLSNARTVAPTHSPEDIVSHFVRQEDLGGEMLDVGLEILE